MRATLHTDGAARHKTGEPMGPAGIGAVLHSQSDEIIGEIATGIGLATNNVAEYTALIAGLQMALDAGVTDIDVQFRAGRAPSEGAQGQGGPRPPARWTRTPDARPLLNLVARPRAALAER